MTTNNNTETNLYEQLMAVNKCIDALKDIYLNIPDDDNYAAALSIIGERLSLEFNLLMPIALTAATATQQPHQS